MFGRLRKILEDAERRAAGRPEWARSDYAKREIGKLNNMEESMDNEHEKLRKTNAEQVVRLAEAQGRVTYMLELMEKLYQTTDRSAQGAILAVAREVASRSR